MLNEDYRDILSAFSDEDVRYLLVGAYALAAHGKPRATGDIDLWVEPDRKNAERVLTALATFGAATEQLSIADFTSPDVVVQIGIAPRRIDVMTSIDGVDDFQSAWQSRDEIEIEGIKVSVISRPDLLVNKRATGRIQDIADAAWLAGESE